nr:hypothetical protein [Tanacetum cinerariifolium]
MYERCGNDLRDGFCSLCNSRNSCVYDPNPNSFDFPPDSCHPPHPTYETYSCDSYGNDSHFGYDCQPQFPRNYESEPGYIENYNFYPYNSSSFPQQEPCCEDCEGLSEIPAYCDDDDDSAITPDEPVDSLSMGDEHLNTISAMKSDEFIKSCVENLVSNPSESEGESEYDMPAREEFITFSNILFNADYEFDSSDDQSCSDEDVPKKKISNPLFEEEIIPIKIDQHHDNVESTHDSSLIISSKIDSLLDEFVGELTLLKSIPLGIDETDCHPEEDIHLIERLLYDNSSPRPPKEFVSENTNANIESFSLSHIPVEDSDSRMEEINLNFTPDDPMPPSIEDDDDDSERDILIHEEFLDNYSLSLSENESFYFDIPSLSRPPAKPPDGNTRILNIKMMGDNSEQKVPIPGLMITLVPNQEKSPALLSHRGLKNFQLSAKCPMMIHEKNIPILDVPLFYFYPLDQLNILGNLKTRAKGFCPRSLHFLSFILGIILLHLAGSQPMLKSSYKAEASVIISIPPLVGGVADVVVEIKGTGKRKPRKGQNQIKTGQKGKRGEARKSLKQLQLKEEEKPKKKKEWPKTHTRIKSY